MPELLLRLRPAGCGSLSLLSAVEVALLEAIAAQDLDPVDGRRLGGGQRRRWRRNALAGLTVLSAHLARGRGGRRRLALRDRTVAHQARRAGAVRVDRLRIRPAAQ